MRITMGLTASPTKPNDGTVDGDIATVNITVNPVNDVPVAVDDSYTTAEDTALNIAAPGVLDQRQRRGCDTITAVLVMRAQHMVR